MVMYNFLVHTIQEVYVRYAKAFILSAMMFSLPLICKEYKIKCQIRIRLLTGMFCTLLCCDSLPFSATAAFGSILT